MKAKNIIFIMAPCMVVACEDITSPGCLDPLTRDLKEYARIVRQDTAKYKAGQIFWDKHHSMNLSEDQRIQIENMASRIANSSDKITRAPLA